MLTEQFLSKNSTETYSYNGAVHEKICKFLLFILVLGSPGMSPKGTIWHSVKGWEKKFKNWVKPIYMLGNSPQMPFQFFQAGRQAGKCVCAHVGCIVCLPYKLTESPPLPALHWKWHMAGRLYDLLSPSIALPSPSVSLSHTPSSRPDPTAPQGEEISFPLGLSLFWGESL